MSKHDDIFGFVFFPYPLTMTLLSNLCTAAVIEVVSAMLAASHRKSVKARQPPSLADIVTPNPTVRNEDLSSPLLSDESSSCSSPQPLKMATRLVPPPLANVPS